MKWTEDLAVGVETIDIQHQELFRRIDNLVVAIREHRCKSEIDGTLQFLEDYATFHFAAEEKKMLDAGYADYPEHHELHKAYMKGLSELKELAAKPRIQGASYELSVTTNQVAVDWIVDHIMKIDKKFGAFLKAKH